ncbi:hypothetical protein GpartN1_g2425.t1 [Galdieria partita]|uniref:Translocon-associated protein subunit beta n=1 Tax=Galdieria partita TaxID=83374 RepID=A0A9C7PUE7_9RHOD|nr:hypothetical protein GpartN1_g2425.t1 [Galdieria partita]
MSGKPFMTFVTLLLVLSFFATYCFAREGAFILVSRRLLSEDLVEGSPFNVTYEVHNAGNSDAQKVVLEDPNFGNQDFMVLNGSVTLTWDVVVAGEKKVTVVTVQPLHAGDFGARPLRLSYRSSKTNVEHESVALASEILFVYTRAVYERLKGSHLLAWSVFFLGTCVIVGVPFVVYILGDQSLRKTKRKTK